MKSKDWIGIVMALTLCVGVFFAPVTAFAATGKDTTAPKLTAELSGETVKIQASDEGSGLEAVYIDSRRVATLVNGSASVALKDYHGNNKEVKVYAVDYAGNKSDTVTFTNPLYTAPVSLPATSTPAPSSSSSSTPAPAASSSSSQAPAASSSSSQSASSSSSQSQSDSSSSSGSDSSSSSDSSSEPTVSAIPDDGEAFTPDGAGEVQDIATEESKSFYTVTTPDGYVYYLVIDHARDSDNVYFLNAVTEGDLAGLTDSATVPGQSAIPDTSEPDEPVDTPAPDSDTDSSTPDTESGGFGTIIFVLLIVAAVGGAGWYFKIYRPKQQAAMDDEEDFDEDGGEDWDGGDDALADGYDYDAEETYQSEDDVEYFDGEEDNS